jgi:aerobic carbon-monoxide dehydrogenase large subunit
LMEAIVYDTDGQLVSGSFQDYSMPRAHHFPQFTAEFLPILAASNPLGIKGAGEAGATGAPPAIMHAILDALRPAGVEHIDMPATPLRVWESLKSRQKKSVP